MSSNFKEGVEFELANGDKRSFHWEDVVYFKSNGYLTDLHYFDKGNSKKVVVNRRIGQIEEDLDYKNFNIFRSHRSFLINIDNMQPYEKYPPSELKFRGNLTAKLSRRKKLDFHKLYRQTS